MFPYIKTSSALYPQLFQESTNTQDQHFLDSNRKENKLYTQVLSNLSFDLFLDGGDVCNLSITQTV